MNKTFSHQKQEQKFHPILKIPKPKCVSGDFEQL